jgi:membrane-associated phospholipid phosphatase
MIAHYHHSWAEPYLWTIGYALAATTAYLRIAADKHYFTDVITGTAVGIGAGLAVPIVEEHAQLVPNGTGVAVVGTF